MKNFALARAKMLRSSKVRIGKTIRLDGIPAILFGVAGIVLAAGAVKILERMGPSLPETLRETKGVIEAVKRNSIPLQS